MNVTVALALVTSSIGGAVPLALTGTANAVVNSVTPSTNDINKTKNWAHVNELSKGLGSVTLQFVSQRNFSSCFEYRTDGDTTQQMGTPNYNTFVPDLYPYWCQSNNSRIETIAANRYVEVRMVFGAETDERFDWTRFDVLTAADSNFLSQEKYVRANNGSDLAASVRVPGAAEEVRFHFDGTATDAHNVPGYEHLQSGQWPKANGDKQFRVATALPGGSYTVTAEYRIGANWYPVTGNAKTYSIDAPTASYVLPSDGSHIFRPSDNPVRLKVDDEFEQFSRMVVTIHGTSYEVPRANCDLRQAGKYLLCDVNTSPTWTGLPEGTYTASTTTYTKANNRVDNLLSRSFTIDGTRPAVLSLESPAISQGTIPVSATAADDQGVESVHFYVTEPRSDGVCTGNGTILAEQRVFDLTSGKYQASLTTSVPDGVYCVNAAARDNAWNNSSIVSNAITIDNTAPVIEINGTTPKATYKLNEPINVHAIDNNFDRVEVDRVDSAAPDNDKHWVYTGKWFGLWWLKDGTYRLTAYDKAGNTTVHEFITDETKPVVVGSTEAAFNPANLTITATDASSGIKRVTGNIYKYDPLHTGADSEGYYLFEGNSSTTQNPFTVVLSSLDEGQYYVKYNAQDVAGNTSNTEKFYFTVDHTAPDVQITGYGQTGNVIQPNVTATDPSTPLSYSWTTNTGVTVSNTSALNPTFAVTTDGTYTFELTVTDAAGNSATVPFTFTYTTPPAPATPTFSNVRSATTTTPSNPAPLTDDGQGTNDQEVEGASTTADGNKNDTKLVENAASSSKFLGLGWWWLAVLAVLVLLWFLFGQRGTDNKKK